MVQVKTNKPKCVSVEMQPSKPKTVDKVHEHISLFPLQAGQVDLNKPLVPPPPGKHFFSKCWEMFGRSVCCSCTLEPHKVSLKVRGLPDWAAESDHWPQNTAGTKPALSSRWCAESGASVLDCDMPQHSLAVFALKPEQINTSSYINNLDRAGKTHVQPATKEGHRKV